MARLNERGKGILGLHAHHRTWMNLTKECKATNVPASSRAASALSGALTPRRDADTLGRGDFGCCCLWEPGGSLDQIQHDDDGDGDVYRS
jgi:hypothetical protein